MIRAPETWTGVFSSEWGEVEWTRDVMARFTRMALERPHASALRYLSSLLSCLVALTGPEEAATAAEPLLGRCEPELASAGRLFVSLDPPYAAIGVLSFVNAAELCGAAHGLVEASPARSWLRTIATLRLRRDDPLRHSAALVAVALGEPELAARLANARRLPATFTPGRAFGDDDQSFVHYLAVATARRAPPEAVRPAWNDYVSAFPAHRSADRTSWNDLGWAARAYFVRIEGKEVGAVGASLHAEAKHAAGAPGTR